MERLLERLAETVTSAEDLESLARPMLELLETVTGMESTYLTRIDVAAGKQHIVFSRNSRDMQIPEGLAVDWGDTLCKRALEENRPYTDDVAGCWGDSDAARALGIRTYLSQPVRYGDGELYGTLCAASGARQPVSPEALKILGMFARLLTAQVDRERRLQQLTQDNVALASRALTDPLTGLANRRALNEELPRILARLRREGGSVHVAFIDLDGSASSPRCRAGPPRPNCWPRPTRPCTRSRRRAGRSVPATGIRTPPRRGPDRPCFRDTGMKVG